MEQELKQTPREWVQEHYGPTNGLTHDQIIILLNSLIRYYGSQKACAEALSVSEWYVIDFLRGECGLDPVFLEVLSFDVEPVYKLRGTRETQAQESNTIPSFLRVDG